MPSVARILRVALFALLASGALRATTVVPPSFPELVGEAQVIARARVTAVEPRWATTAEGRRVIKTYVTFAVLKTLKGEPQNALTLEFLGGELDGQGMRVDGMPRFAVGDVEIVFVAGNRVRFCPLVGMMHGRYRVLTDPATARDYVARNDGVPLQAVDDVQLPQDRAAGPRRLLQAANGLSPDAFENQIATEVSRRAQP